MRIFHNASARMLWMTMVSVAILLLDPVSAHSQVQIVKLNHLQSIVDTKSDKVQVVNFWATWCGPCVKELPLFETLERKKDPGVKVTLVSLDFVARISQVNKFVQKRSVASDVILLDETDYNAWIDKIDPQWSGAIPATLIVNTQTGKRKLLEKELEAGELEKYIEEVRK